MAVCECGCGSLLGVSKRFILGHNARVRKYGTFEQMYGVKRAAELRSKCGERTRGKTFEQMYGGRARVIKEKIGAFTRGKTFEQRFGVEKALSIKSRIAKWVHENPLEMRCGIERAKEIRKRMGDGLRREVGSKGKDGGYVVVKMEDGSWYAEHRYVVEQFIGRKLTTEETVHHINEDREDNRLENLMLFDTNASHMRYHMTPEKVGIEHILFDGGLL